MAQSERQRAVQLLSEFKCEGVPQGFREREGYEEGDEHRPFFTEAYLYTLIGKEDARTLLCRIKRVQKAMGAEVTDSEGETLGEWLKRRDGRTVRILQKVWKGMDRVEALKQHKHLVRDWLKMIYAQWDEANCSPEEQVLDKVAQIAALAMGCLEEHWGITKECSNCRNWDIAPGAVRCICKVRSDNNEMVLTRPTHKCLVWAERGLP